VVLLLITAYTGWQMWDIHHFGHIDDGTHADCAIVLGAAAYHQKPSPVFKERINHAILLLNTNRVKAIILTGGYGENAKYAESEVALKYCLENGVHPHQIHIETISQNTQENIIEAKKIMETKGFKSSLIVSDPWHLRRACNIADHYQLSAKPSATKTSLYTSDKIQLKSLWKECLNIHLWKFN
jgi:vancomycin permeability regulator SanA